ncbi:MAG: phosphotransferase [Rhodobacteraceae bacterium]|nr:phosphotransferase [Paracoccaceae bacterium]
MSGTNDAAAIEALGHWGGSDRPPRMISERENAVFEVALVNAPRAALRLHRAGYNSPSAVQSELWWSGQLAAKGFPTPSPIPANDGRLSVALSDGRIATMLNWAEGEAIGSTDLPLAGSRADQCALYHDLGSLLARLHAISDELSLPPAFDRRNWDIDGFLGDQPLWGRFWENPALNAQDLGLINAARVRAIADLKRYAAEGADRGLIHADPLRENVFRNAGGLALIDFDDSGFGFRLYDLTTALSQSLDDDNYGDLRSAILAGYAEQRPLDDQAEHLFSLFAMLRTFASLGWVMPRLSANHPAIPRYVGRARKAVNAYLR